MRRRQGEDEEGAPASRTAAVPGGFKLIGISGPNEFRFSGRIGDKTLAPGSYRLVAKAQGTAGRSSYTQLQDHEVDRAALPRRPRRRYGPPMRRPARLLLTLALRRCVPALAACGGDTQGGPSTIPDSRRAGRSRWR